MKDGLLSIELVREIPDAMKPRKIEIGTGRSHRIEAETAPEKEPEVA
jgi:molecular chaperone IbpA